MALTRLLHPEEENVPYVWSGNWPAQCLGARGSCTIEKKKDVAHLIKLFEFREDSVCVCSVGLWGEGGLCAQSPYLFFVVVATYSTTAHSFARGSSAA